MSGHLKVFIAIVVLGALAIVGYRFARPFLTDAAQRQTSDAAATRGKASIGMDSWIGYFPLCSPQMERRMRVEGYVLRCEDDKADYATRFQRLANGELDFAVSTVDAWLLNGKAFDYPAAIVAVIDESKGGDAIVARRARVPDLDTLKRVSGSKIAFTPASPSEHLLKSIGVHFDLPQLRERRGAWRVEASGSSDALARLNRGEVDVAVLWEPDVSRALADPAYVKLIGSDDTEKLIVDVLLASRRVLQERPELVQAVLEQYFDSLLHYTEDSAALRKDAAAASGLPADQVEAMLGGVRWVSLNENGALWFGISPTGVPTDEGLIEAMRSATSVLIAAGDFSTDPIPDGDPYRLTNRQPLSALYLQGSGLAIAGTAVDGLARTFSALDDAGWARLREVGTLRIEPISFARGTANLDEQGVAALAAVAERLSHYPNYRLVVKGHTGIDGEARANLDLSQKRALAVVEHLIATYRMDQNRIRGLGFGGTQPLARREDESDRAFGYRLPRVELALVSEPL